MYINKTKRLKTYFVMKIAWIMIKLECNETESWLKIIIKHFMAIYYQNTQQFSFKT